VVELVTEPMATAVKPALRTAAAIIGLIFIDKTSYPVGKETDWSAHRTFDSGVNLSCRRCQCSARVRPNDYLIDAEARLKR
jgi:hypothetical protein